MPLINCEISLNLKRSEYCVITDTTARDAQGDNGKATKAVAKAKYLNSRQCNAVTTIKNWF